MLCAFAAALVTSPAVGVLTGHAAPSADSTAGPLPFDLPAPAALRASGKLVFANYVPALPVSIDNKAPESDYYAVNYLTPGGEKGIHAAHGGYLRDRPTPRPPRSGSAWKLADMQEEVRQAISEGVDGFTVVLYNLPGDPDSRVWDNAVLMLQAAASVDPSFKVILMPDMTSMLKDKSIPEMARYLAQLGAMPAAYHLGDGRLVLSPFFAEAKPLSYWLTLMATMTSARATPVAFVPTFMDEQPYFASWSPYTYGMATWGNRTPAWNNPDATFPTSGPARARRVIAAGQVWMQPVSMQDERPRAGIYYESQNTTNLRDTWQIAIKTGAPWVQLNTWNDLPENTHMQPSVRHGWTFMDINAYYLAWFKLGKAPAIVRDSVYLTHRTQFLSAQPTYPQSLLMHLPTSAPGSPGRDTIEALTFLTAPATVTIKAGATTTRCDAPAGVGVCTVPLGLGTVSATVTRAASVVASVVSPYPVTATPYVQDLEYVGVSSGRSGLSTGPQATAPAAARVAIVPTSVPATADLPASVPTAPQVTATPQVTAPTVPVSPTVPISPTLTATPAQATPPQPTGSVTPAVPGSDPIVTLLEPVADTYANDGAPLANYAGDASLASRQAPEAAPFLRFAFPSTPSGKQLVSAVLHLRTNTLPFAGSSQRFEVRTASDAWDEKTVTGLNVPQVGSTVLGSFTAPKADTDYYVAMSPALVTSLAGAWASVTVVSSGVDDLWFWSRDFPTASYRPNIVLTWR